ncbi:heat shock 70 kDa protein 12A-like isoform X3 [Mytilus californianus]|uniref:heat shock 70 kDa protein 12A-like isoform X3 n=1 Tax=Mytilus californianus TaxID=6549 RepID=UPI0022469A2E|nr:heat shock 70 kDa protein 12A-like isoform X3 [Mytilus californianus]
MWVCLNCHEYNDPNNEKCGKCEIPRQQKEKPKGKHEHKNANLFNRKTMYTRGNSKGWQKAIQPGYERQSVVGRLEATSLAPTIQPGYQRKSAVGRLESTSLAPTIQPGYQRKSAVGRLEATSLAPTIQPGNEQKTFAERLDALSLAGSKKEHDSDYLVVAALDFGTAYSGYAFSMRSDFKTDPLKIHVNQAWNAGSRQLLSLKTPTALLLNPDKEFEAFGYEAETTYANLAMDDTNSGYFLFRRFKMNLHNKKKIGNDLIIEDIAGKPMAALDVFTLSIKTLVKHVMAHLEKRGTGVKLAEIRWVLTVPAIWTDSAKQFMRKGAVQAGIPENKLYIALEPEAASIFCQYLPTEKLNGADFKMAKPGTKYMVVDLGGGTADITVHEKVSNEHLKELSSATGNNCGGTSVDERFLQIFVDIFGRPLMNALKEEDSSSYLDLFLEFETVKRIIEPDKNSKITICIPYPSINSCCLKLLNKDIESAVRASKYGNKVTLKCGKLRIDSEIVKDIFKPTIESIVSLMKDIFEKTPSADVSQILLVGGFSECALVQDAIKRAFPDKRVINPDEAGLAVLKGACLFGHKPDYITSRVMQYTYGTGTSLPFDANIHDKEHLVIEEDGEFCDGLFEVIVRKNDTVDINTAIEHNFTVDCNDQEPWELSLYASTKEKPMYVDEKGCTLLGSMKISFSKASETERELRVAFLFGNTELGVTATDILTGETISSTFNLN